MLHLLHRLAAPRGDGLRPELLELLSARRAIDADPRIVDLATRRGDRFVQAGPHPAHMSAAAEALNFGARTATLPSSGAGLRKAGND